MNQNPRRWKDQMLCSLSAHRVFWSAWHGYHCPKEGVQDIRGDGGPGRGVPGRDDSVDWLWVEPVWVGGRVSDDVGRVGTPHHIFWKKSREIFLLHNFILLFYCIENKSAASRGFSKWNVLFRINRCWIQCDYPFWARRSYLSMFIFISTWCLLNLFPHLSIYSFPSAG